MRPASLPPRAHWLTRPHGTRLRYLAGCGCVPCRAANSRYETHRNLKRAQGDWNGIIDAAPAVAHLRTLGRLGMGLRRVAYLTGINRTILVGVKTGRRTRMRARHVRTICQLTLSVAPHALVPAADTWLMVAVLVREGYPKMRLARFLGYRGQGLPLGRDQVTMLTEARVARLYLWLMAEDTNAPAA